MSPIKEPCRVGTISSSGIIFLGKGRPTLKAHATGPLCGPVSGSPSSRPNRGRMPILLRCPDLPWPTRCSRDTAKVAVFRLASSRPDNRPPSGELSCPTTRPWVGGARTLKRVRREWGACPPHGATKCGRGVSGPAPRADAATGREGNEPHQR
jgi:hypothetical protein